MKVGSLVVCVRCFVGNEEAKPVVKGKIYTVRDILYVDGDYGVMLDEIVNDLAEYREGVLEPAYTIDRFRELDTPTEISIEEFLTQEV